MDRSNLKSVIHIVAGGYVVYLGIKLIRGMNNGEMNGTWYYYLISAIFIAAGAFIAVNGVRRLIKNGAIYWNPPQEDPDNVTGEYDDPDYQYDDAISDDNDPEGYDALPEEADDAEDAGGSFDPGQGSFLNAYKYDMSDDADQAETGDEEL